MTFIGWGGTFQDYLREAYLKPFEKETGIRALETTVPSLAKLKMMVEAKNVEVDVADGQGFVLTELGKRGYLEEIDYDAMGRDVVSASAKGRRRNTGRATTSVPSVSAIGVTYLQAAPTHGRGQSFGM